MQKTTSIFMWKKESKSEAGFFTAYRKGKVIQIQDF